MKRRTDKISNVTYEAYTGNSLGRKESRTLLKQYSFVSPDLMRMATVLKSWKPIQRNRYGEIPEGSPESKSMAWRKRSASGTLEASMFPREFRGVGHDNDKKHVR